MITNIKRVFIGLFLFSILVLAAHPGNGYGAIGKTKQVIPIKNISNIKLVMKQGENFTQPSQIIADMSDGSMRRLKVTWDKILDTNSVGNFTALGSVKDYKRKVMLSLRVNNFITSIMNIELEFKQGEQVNFPQTVKALTSDNQTVNVPVQWNSETIDTSQIGVYTFIGTVDGYDKGAYLKIAIKNDNKSTKEIATLKNEVVTILGYDDYNVITGFGSGFVVSQDGLVVTCYHVIDGYQKCKVVLENGKIYDVDYVVNYDKNKDIAILQLKNAKGMPYLTFGSDSKLEVGDDMVAIGSPQGYDNTVSNGIISGLDRQSDMRTGKDIQFTAGVTSGSSGGAILNMKGEVVGMVYATYSTGNLSMAVPASEIEPFLAATNKSSLVELNPLTPSQVYELKLEDTCLSFTKDTSIMKPTEIYVDVYDQDKEVDITLSYYNDACDNFMQTLYNPILGNDPSIKPEVEAWIKAIYEDVKRHYPKMEVYGYITGHKSFNDKPDEKLYDNVSLGKATGKWNAYRTFCTFSEDENSKNATSTENKFEITWKKLESK